MEKSGYELKKQCVVASISAMVLLSAAMLIWWISSSSAQVSAVPKANSVVERGREVYRKAGCWYCHNPQLEAMRWGPKLQIDPDLNWWSAFLGNPQALRPNTSKRPYRWLLQPTTDGRMELNADGQALIAYLRHAGAASSLKATSTRYLPHKRLLKGDGPTLYQISCAGCHGVKGFGDGEAAKYMPTAPRDLTRPQTWLCRSQTKANISDIQRTISRQTGGCAMLAMARDLSAEQTRALVDVVRQKAGLYDKTPDHPALAWTRPDMPNDNLLRQRPFRKWLDQWWENYFKQLKADPHTGAQVAVFNSWHAWRESSEWRSFGLWLANAHDVQSDERDVRLSRADWISTLRHNPHFHETVALWEKNGRQVPLQEFIAQQMKISLHNHLQKEYDKQRDRLRPERRPWWKFWGRLTAKRDWIKREFQREWPRWQNNAGYVIYEKWRERREEQLFRTWKTQREGELYLAWQGREIYAQVGCSRCHGTDGNGQQLPTKATSPPIQQQHRHNLIGANPRCGNQMFDFYRSIITGVGQQMPMLSSEDIRPLVGKMQIIRGSLEQYRDDPPAKLRQALWSLAAYAQFLAHQNPIQRGAKMRE